MGNQEGSNFEKDFNNSYSYIQVVDDPNYGLVKVYRKKMVNYDYIMVYQESLAGFSQQQINQLEGDLDRITSEPNELLLKLHFFRIVQENTTTCTIMYLRLYLEYFNFSLQNLITNNHSAKTFLTLDQILYILNSAITVAKFFRAHRVDWFNISVSQIFLAPTGCIYFSPVRISKSSNQMNICGGCTLKPEAKYANRMPVSSGKDLKAQLKKLLTDFTSCYPQQLLSQFQPIQKAIESADNIYNVLLPPSKCSAIDMIKQMYKVDDRKAKKETLSTFSNNQSRSTSRPFSNEINLTNQKSSNTQSRLFLRTR